ncbi:conserved hypothetical protein [Sporisorium reilianum SRZ2]|uniref:Phospholipase/carboxylesterase/thioesterase domain-containing protein n=1 Tax=Sporisorium reilianum (strain SRZ2) TaxID=999809 RepID=E6ZSD0_SPORE|nr:conserved hypothetical protein [Sporisorium reilianum SRZ2]
MSSSTEEIPVDATRREAITKPLLPTAALSKFSAHHFSASPSGVDSNLLLLLHGLGDTDRGFFALGQTLQRTLPQTAVLTLQAPHAVPFLDGAHWMWYASFDRFGELLTAPNPTQTVSDVLALLEHLVAQCAWPAGSIHLFGFGQGATVALETMVHWSTTHPANALGSIVSVSGTLVSHPTTPPSPTPVLQVYRSLTDTHTARWASHRKATSSLQLHRLPLAKGQEEAMLTGTEWDGVMQFWARLLRSRSSWERDGEVVRLG